MTKEKAILKHDIMERDLNSRKIVSRVCIITIILAFAIFMGYMQKPNADAEYYKITMPIAIFAAGLVIALVKYFVTLLEEERNSFASLLEDLNEVIILHKGSLNSSDSSVHICEHVEIISKLERICTLVRIGTYSEYRFALQASDFFRIANFSNTHLKKYAETDKSFVIPYNYQTIFLFSTIRDKYVIDLT